MPSKAAIQLVGARGHHLYNNYKLLRSGSGERKLRHIWRPRSSTALYSSSSGKEVGKKGRCDKGVVCNKNIVVLGGSFGGWTAARRLSDYAYNSQKRPFRNHKGQQVKLNITLIERKDFFEYTPSILRALVGVDAKTGRSRVLKDIYARTAAGTKATFLRGDIFNLSPDAVEVRPIVSNDGVATNNGSSSISNDIDDIVKIPYDYCIIATGTAYKSPIRDSSSEEWTRSQRERMVNQWALKLQEADEIVIVGGAVDIEEPYSATRIAAQICSRRIIMVEIVV
eukprot:jgi/Bigna1/72430/fgenesh1_pg.19_\